MKTRRKKLQYNITKKKHKKFSRKKKTYKNKTLKGGNYIIIASALGVGAAASGFGWRLYSKKKRKNSKKRLDKSKRKLDQVYKKIGNDPDDDKLLDEGKQAARPPVLKFDSLLDQERETIVNTPNECNISVEQDITKLTIPYFTNPEFKKCLETIKGIYSEMDKNPKVGDMISLHNDFYNDFYNDDNNKFQKMFQKQNKAYKLFIPDLDTTVIKKVPIQYRPPMEIIYKDSINYYCIYNGGVIEENSIFKLATSVSRGGADLGKILKEQDEEDLSDPVLDDVGRKEAEKRQFNRVVGDKIIQNLGSIKERKTLSIEKKKLRYTFFVSLNNLFYKSNDIRDFYNTNVKSLDEKDYDIIKAFIFGETEEYKHYISVYGTNAMKKIKLLNLISSNTICKFLMDYIEQKLSVSDGITKGTQIYDLISESIRINWRINNIYDEDEKFILYGREDKQLPSEDKYELFNEPTRQLLDGLRMNEQQYIGGSGRTIPQETELQKRRRERKEKINNSRLKLQEIQLGKHVPPPSGLDYYLSIIQDKLYLLNSQKQIPYEVLLILLGFILSTRGYSTMTDNKLVLVAINIVYNEIFTYSRQVLYELFDGPEVIKKKYRAQPGVWSRIIYSIPITTPPGELYFQDNVKTRNILVKPGGYIVKRLVQLSKDLVQTISDFKKNPLIEYFSVETDCKAFISESEIKELEKKRLYSVYYFMLKYLDDEWNKETIQKYKTNLDLLFNGSFDNLVEEFGDGSVINTFKEIGLLDLESKPGTSLLSKALNLRSWQHITGPIT